MTKLIEKKKNLNPYQHSFGGNIPQDVAGKQGDNVFFIVYTLKDSPETLG